MKPILTAIVLTMSSTIAFATESTALEVYSGNVDKGGIKSSTCIACHGADGNSSVTDYPKLAGQHPGYLTSTLKAYRDGSRANAVMQGMASALSDEDIADLAAYFSSQAVSNGAVEANFVARGKQLYRFGDSDKGISACTACHGPTGAGLASANFPSLKGQWAAYSELQLSAFRDGLRVNVMMNGVAKNMSNTDIKAISSYVGGLF